MLRVLDFIVRALTNIDGASKVSVFTLGFA
jgi:hypothetical protein